MFFEGGVIATSWGMVYDFNFYTMPAVRKCSFMIVRMSMLRNADTLMYGRTTYQLMASYWPTVVKNPTGNKPMDDFAVLIDNISKIVFSRTLWRSHSLL